MKFQHILKATAGAEILAVIEGLPVDKPGYFLSEDQLSAVDAALEASAGNADVIAALNANNTKLTEDLQAVGGQLTKATEDLATAQTELATATANAAKATEDLATATAKITEQEGTIATLNEKVEELGKNDPKRFTALAEDKDDIPDENANVDPLAMDFQKELFSKI